MFITKIDLELEFHTDPGHGWLRVPYHFLKKFNILDKITSCSFIKGNWAYLEEDCDLSTLTSALSMKGIAVDWQEKSINKYSPIRSYDHFSTR